MTTALRLKARDRAANCCEYCLMQADFSHDPFSAEHIFPVAKGGIDELQNLAWSCLGCNFHKFTATHALDFISGNLVSLYNPRREKWEEHFKWEENFTLIVGTTPTGRATVTRLRLNRFGLVNLRKVLVDAGKHPPTI